MIEPGPTTLFGWLETHAQQQPDAAAILSAQGTVSFAELADSTRRLASGLAQIGVGPGDVVAVQLPNCPEFYTLLLATAARGATFQTLHMPYRHAELSSLLAHGEAKVAVAQRQAKDRNPAPEIAALINELPHLETVVSVGGSDDYTTTDFAELSAAVGTPRTISEPNIDAPYVLLYTSGTTAGPKGVLHTARRFLSNAALASAELRLGPDDRVTSLAPFSHLYGLFTLQIGLAAGACATMIPAFDPQTFFQDLAVLAPTALFAAPAHLAPFVANGALQPAHLAGIDLLCMSGAKVPESLARSVDAMLDGGSVIGLWGMTELQVGTFGRRDDPLASRVSTTGRAAIGMELRVVDSDAHLVEPGAEGELEAKGASTFDGYLRNPEATANAFTNDQWFKTGDLAKLDKNGFLEITGRTKEIINRGGVKYNPAEVEDVLLSHESIVACAIVPIADDVLGERGCLCVEISPGTTLDLKGIRELLERRGIAKFKWPERIERFDALPLTPTRKVRRGVLAAHLAEGPS